MRIHVVIDGQLDPLRVRASFPARDPRTLLDTTAIAETYRSLHVQNASKWTHEIGLRLSVEKF